MRVIRGREADTPSENRTSTFTGTVWADVLLAGEPGVTVNNVFFTAPFADLLAHPRRRSDPAGHRGLGLRRDARRQGRGDPRRATSPGSPRARSTGTAARPTRFLLHTATSIGTTNWLDEVSDADYEKGVGA